MLYSIRNLDLTTKSRFQYSKNDSFYLRRCYKLYGSLANRFLDIETGLKTIATLSGSQNVIFRDLCHIRFCNVLRDKYLSRLHSKTYSKEHYKQVRKLIGRTKGVAESSIKLHRQNTFFLIRNAIFV